MSGQFGNIATRGQESICRSAGTGRQYCYKRSGVHLPLSWVCIEVIYKCLDISWIYINVRTGRQYCYKSSGVHLTLSW
ncbi:hypothetical protein J6590_090916, partial [Homalodisca vitripennis]